MKYSTLKLIQFKQQFPQILMNSKKYLMLSIFFGLLNFCFCIEKTKAFGEGTKMVLNERGAEEPNCTDGIQNGDETGVDLGGSCVNNNDLVITTCGSVSISGNSITSRELIVKNIGTTSAPATTLGYYLSIDTIINSDDYLIGTDNVMELVPENTSQEYNTTNISSISPPIPEGTYYFGALADYNSNLVESNETNNGCYNSSPQFTVTYGCKDADAHNYYANATYEDDSICETCDDGIKNGNETGVDLGGRCVNLSDLVITSCGSVSISDNVVTVREAIVKNVGPTSAPVCTIGFYLSTDTIINSNDYLINTNLVRELVPGDTSPEYNTTNISSISLPIPEGTYYVGAVVDYNSDFAESNDNNNSCYNSSPQFIVTYGCKDEDAHNYNVSATFENANQCETCDDDTQNGDETGIDCGGNKCDPCGAPIIIVTKPNSSYSYFSGEVINIEWIDNISENVNIQLFNDAEYVSDIVTSTESNGSYSYTIPDDLTDSDKYRIRIFSSTNASIMDYSDYFTIQIIAPSCTDGIQNGDETGIDCGGSCIDCGTPDLDITTCGALRISDNLVTVSGIIVKNTGTASAPNTLLGYYLSIDETINSEDYLIGTNDVLSLDQGSTSQEYFTINISNISPPLPEGFYYIGALADYDDSLTESDENNNDCYNFSPRIVVTHGCNDENAHNYYPAATFEDASLCETCFDGIQNGDETGIDCGGFRCRSCINYSITVTKPGTGDAFSPGDTINIEWIHNNISETVNIRLYKGSIYLRDIGTNLPSNSSYSYIVPSTLQDGQQYRIYVRSRTRPSIYDYGDYFSIQKVTTSCTDGIQNGDEEGIDCGGSCPNACITGCLQSDKESLIALYNATDGPNWKRKWNLDLPIEQWYGVSLNEDGCVIELNLSRNKLSGVIPAELGNLEELRELHFHENALTGAIPGSLGDLKKLTVLALTACSFTGEIPPELGSMENLVNLYLYNNKLTGAIPSELNQLTQLKKLYVMSNNLSGCFEPDLLVLCDQIQNNNYYINGGNSFDIQWGDFCANENCHNRLAGKEDIAAGNYPNPFKDETAITYILDEDSKVSVVVYNVSGEQLEILVDNEVQGKGLNTIIFDGSNYSAGIYYYSVQSKDNFDFQKMVLMK